MMSSDGKKYETSVETGWEREVERFRKCYAELKPGWDGEDGVVATAETTDDAVNFFTKFVAVLKDFEFSPRLYMCPDGSFDLDWSAAGFAGLCNYDDGRVDCFLHTRADPDARFVTVFDVGDSDVDEKLAEVRGWAMSQVLPPAKTKKEK